MNAHPRQTEREEWVDEASKWGVGLGIVGVALFPLSIPILVLTAVALVPLLVPVLALGLVAALVGGPFLLARRLVRRRRRSPQVRTAAPSGLSIGVAPLRRRSEEATR